MLSLLIAATLRPAPLGAPPERTRGLSLVPTVSNELLLDMDLSPDGRRMITLAMRDYDRAAVPRLWDTRSNQMLSALRGHDDGVTSSGFSLDGSKFYTLSSQRILIWDANRAVEIARLEPKPGKGSRQETFLSAKFAPNGDLYYGTSQGNPRAEGETSFPGRLGRLKADGTAGPDIPITGDVAKFDVSPDGTKVVLGNTLGSFVVTPTGRVPLAFPIKGTQPISFRFSPDGADVLVTSFNEPPRLDIFDAASGKVKYSQPYRYDVRSVGNIAIGSEFVGKDRGQFFALTEKGDIQLRDRKTYALVRTLTGHEKPIREVRVSSDGTQMGTYGADSRMILWNLTTGKSRDVTSVGHLPTAATFSGDGKRFVVGCENGEMVAIDTVSGDRSTTLFKSLAAIGGYRILADGRLLTLRDAGRNLRGPLFEGDVRGLDAPGNPVPFPEISGDYAISPTGKSMIAVLAGHGAAQVMSTLDATVWKGKKVYYNEAPVDMRYSPDGRYIALAFDDGAMSIFDTDEVSQVASWQFKQEGSFLNSAWTTDGTNILSTNRKGPKSSQHLMLWDPKTGSGRLLGTHDDLFARIAMRPGGESFFLNDDKTLTLRSLADGKTLVTFADVVETSPPGAEVKTSVTPYQGLEPIVSADGRRVALAAAHDFSVWDVETGKRILHKTRPFDSSDAAPAFNGDMSRVAWAAGPVVTVYDVATGNVVAQGRTGEAAHTLQFTADGRKLTSGDSLDGMIIWAINGPQLRREGQFMVGKDGQFLVIDEQGRYDATDPNTVDVANYVFAWSGGLETVPVAAMKSRFYDPGLLGKLLGTNPEPLRAVPSIGGVKLFPSVDVKPDEKKPTRMTVEVTERDGGGIGDVTVLVNGKVLETKKGTGFFRLDTEKFRPFLIPPAALEQGGRNVLTVRATNADGDLVSPPTSIEIPVPADLTVPESKLHALFVGVGNYVGSAGDLIAPPSDAKELAKAVTRVAERLTPGRVDVTVMTTASEDQKPSRDAIKAWLDDKAKTAGARDTVMVFFAGHGTSTVGDKNDYFFLTPDADPTEVGPSVIGVSSISGTELSQWLAQIPAAKQILVLDTCHSGAASKALDLSSRSVSGAYARAYEAIRDGSGTWLLAGSAADGLSYESTRVNHGMLTYALLEAIDLGPGSNGLRSGPDDTAFVDVEAWLRYAADRVETLKAEANVSGVQRPEFRRSDAGRNFDIGLVKKEDKGTLGLQPPLPILIVGTFQRDEEDPAGLEPMMEAALKDGKNFKAWVGVGRHPGAYRVAGTYTAVGDDVTLKAVLQRFDTAGKRETLATETLTGKLADLPGKLRDWVSAKLAELSEKP